MKITSDENVNQAVEQMVQAIRNTDAYLEYQKQLARVKEQPELKRQIDEFPVSYTHLTLPTILRV